MNYSSHKSSQRWLTIFGIIAIIAIASLLLPSLINPNAAQVAPPIPTSAQTATPSPSPTIPISLVDPFTPETLLPSPGTPVPTSPPKRNCTYSAYYWATHPDSWQVQSILFADLSYTKAQAIEIMTTQTDDLSTNLQREFFASLLNMLNGADPTDIETTIIDASEWIGNNPSNEPMTTFERFKGRDLIDSMSNYNLGITGPGQCPDEPSTPTPTHTTTPTPTVTLTRTPISGTFALPPTETSVPDRGKPSKPDTPVPTSPPPTSPPPTCPPPPPEPTQPPAPTATKEIPTPPPTPAPTEPPPTTPP
jgi:hypothetical protein